MIIKPSTALRNDYGSISDLAHTEAVELCCGMCYYLV